MTVQSPYVRSRRVSILGRKVRQIKEATNLTYAQIGLECGIDSLDSPEGKISGLCNGFVIRSDLEPKVVAWVEKNKAFLQQPKEKPNVRTIWKFPLGEPGYLHTIKAPGAPEPKFVGVDPKGVPSIWMEATPDGGEEFVETVTIGTGDKVPTGGGWKYLQSFIHGVYVWHVYVRPISG